MKGDVMIVASTDATIQTSAPADGESRRAGCRWWSYMANGIVAVDVAPMRDISLCVRRIHAALFGFWRGHVGIAVRW